MPRKAWYGKMSTKQALAGGATLAQTQIYCKGRYLMHGGESPWRLAIGCRTPTTASIPWKSYSLIGRAFACGEHYGSVSSGSHMYGAEQRDDDDDRRQPHRLCRRESFQQQRQQQ